VISSRRSTTQKLASLSALGVGAIALGTGKAHASVIYSGPISSTVGTVGFKAKALDSFSAVFGNAGIATTAHPPANKMSHYFRFQTLRYNGVSHAGSTVTNNNARGIGFLGDNRLQFAVTGSTNTRPGHPGHSFDLLPRIYNVGAVWGTSANANNARGGTVASRTWRTRTTSSGGVSRRGGPPHPLSYTDKYALFEFENGSNTYYGWVELSLQINGSNGPSGAAGPNLTVVSYAYTTDPNNPILAGELTEENTTPEPAPFELTGLGALALGAVGLRRWRAKRPA
jgi:hypothetical protein